jgi:riboflavin synthase
MFTGLVRAIGRLEPSSSGVWVRLESAGSLGAIHLGDSIAVDGVCLTVAELLGGEDRAGVRAFRADVSAETLARSALAGRAAAGARVNLEPALRLSDRLGGHLVSGHVDGPGRVCEIRRQGDFFELALAWGDPRQGRFICPKASVAVDGISLTVAGCSEAGETFWIAVIPHTWATTTLNDRKVGDVVNLEADLMAKYAERLLEHRFPLGMPPSGQVTSPETLTSNWLAEHGWMG